MSTDSRRHRWQAITVAVGGTMWILSTLQFGLAQIITAAAWNPPYSWTDNYISDLGNSTCGQFAVPHGALSYVCSPLYTVMNASFIVTGLLTIAGAILLQQIWPPRKPAAVALGLWVITGLGKIVLALYPENTNINLHLLGALNIPVESIAILLLSLSILRTRPIVGLVGLAVAIVGLLGTVLGIVGEIVGPTAYFGLGVGGMERVADYPGSLWMLLIGALALASAVGVFNPDARRNPLAKAAST